MLRFEKLSKSTDLNISMRQKSQLWTKTFSQAFVLALIVHIAGFFIFKVKPFFVSDIDTIFPPVTVNTDMIKHTENGTYAEFQNEKSKREIPKIPQLYPKLPNISLEKETYPIFLPNETFFEDVSYFLKNDTIKQLSPGLNYYFTIDLDDSLHEHLKKETKSFITLDSLLNIDKIVYKVDINEQTGRIKDFTIESGCKDHEACKQVESLLSEMEFDKIKLTGIITIRFDTE